MAFTTESSMDGDAAARGIRAATGPDRARPARRAVPRFDGSSRHPRGGLAGAARRTARPGDRRPRAGPPGVPDRAARPPARLHRGGRRVSTVDVALEPVPGSIPLARDALESLRGQLDEARIDDLRLVVSELVTN